jgi:hypothetical protein
LRRLISSAAEMNKLAMRSATLLILAAGIGPPVSAWASSYAVSYDTISGFTLAFGGGAGNLSPFTFSVDAALTNYGVDAGLAMMDAPAACVNCSYNNSFVSHGSATQYAYGDARIANSNVQGGVGAARSIGEVSAFNSAGSAFGSNTMTASFVVSGTPGTASFSFLSTPYMNTALLPGGVSASANQLMSISINHGLTNIFEWKPDGIVGNAFGGTESFDPFTLNSSLAGNALFNPGSGSFAAVTNSLSTGTYTLKITMANYVSATSATVVPIPAAVWLFGSGLLGLVGVVRRKKKTC